MALKDLFKKPKYVTVQPGPAKPAEPAVKREIPEGLWQKCAKCGQIVFIKELERNLKVCPHCQFHFHLTARERIQQLVDGDSFVELDAGLTSVNPLGFPGYEGKLAEAQSKTGLKEAVVCGTATIGGQPVMLVVMDNQFIMASMGSAVGEKITRAIEAAIERRLPVVVFATSGGARMQEGILSLMQMGKTSLAVRRLKEAGLLYITVLTDPTTGGVTASFASQGDIILAEPGALIGFAGPRVIEQTIRQKLPEGFQRAEFLQQHGQVDKVVHRKELATVLTKLLAWHQPQEVRA
ncbi:MULTISPECIES: acetyl-CoA carboxylase, carboxyltransferase subunit beta [unclassified Carboxydocella]|uniref:acetyl-CoA carboxylase, carboxyltransferase subunit beta n=1 Tax=unclassified Carboxydocella TaxID=2685367 RepID=UPI0009AC9AF1|nr:MULTISPECIES: acetyl-CoA carboxylase, carboxyltransferase subunit beta [unclassified Carboxydocella]GAW28702.1 acetyl-CoA carboxylase subunit beta [Carboxydocella sp. ULO1]GAW30547.1 acetyl-CoA carboxylase subunit beta [Carboxydocella sp. JDF658]